MSEARRILGTPLTFEYKAKKYELRPITLENLAQYEAWLESQAYRKVERYRGMIPEQVYQERLDSVSRLVAVGTFRTSGPLAQASTLTEEGQRYLIYLMLQGNHGMTEALTNEILDEQGDLIGKLMSELNADPNAEAPTQESGQPSA